MKQSLDLIPTKNLTLPEIPEHWDYDESISKVNTFVYKWKTLKDEAPEVLEELWIANQQLSVDPHISGGMRGRNKSSNLKTWSDYCEEIGLERRTVNRWLEKAYSSKKITAPNQPEFDENIETEHQCPSCGYEW